MTEDPRTAHLAKLLGEKAADLDLAAPVALGRYNCQGQYVLPKENSPTKD